VFEKTAELNYSRSNDGRIHMRNGIKCPFRLITGTKHVTGEYAGCSAAFPDSTIAARTSPPSILPAGVEGGAGGDWDGTAKPENFTTTPSSVVALTQKERGWCDIVVLDPYLE
jgi:hypothetical protein